jgi:hypothetical protein
MEEAGKKVSHGFSHKKAHKPQKGVIQPRPFNKMFCALCAFLWLNLWLT